MNTKILKKFCYVFVFCLVMTNLLFSQNFVYNDIKIKTVSFTKGNLTIQKDDGTGSYSSPQWTSQSNEQNPVAYISGVAPSITANFTFQCSNGVPASIYIRANASDSIDFPAAKVSLTSGSGNVYTFVYPETTGSHIFKAGVVRYFKPFIINWEISFNGNNWAAIGSTKNTLYVTYKTPQAETSQFKWFHTVFDLSCRNAIDSTTEKSIISGIWNEFTDQVILNYNGDSLFYYKKIDVTYQTLALLLKYRDAQCYTFAQLFLAAIKIQGIIRTNNYVYIAGKSKTVCGAAVDRFLVKNWIFGNPTGTSSCAAFPYKMVYNLNDLKANHTTYTFISTDIKDQAGSPGSCTKNPASFFANHQIAFIDGVYYDASYGQAFKSLLELKEKEIEAWGIASYNGNQVTCFFTNNVSATELGESITTY